MTYKKHFILLITLISSSVLFAQKTETRFSNIQADLYYGFPIEHDQSLDNAVQGNAYGLYISWNNVSTKKNKFNLLYNYPERGFSFFYENFNSTVLGEAYGLYRHYTYNLTPKRKNHLKLTTAFGVAYATKKYDAILNPTNFAIGSNFLVSAIFKLQYWQFFSNNKLSVNTGVSIAHFSNMSFKNPNLGLNTLTLNVGVNYKLTPVEVSKIDTTFTEDKSLKYSLIFRGGYNQSKIVDSDLHPFFTATFNVGKTINNYSTLTGGIEYFNSGFLKEYAEDTNASSNNTSRAGVYIGHQLTQNNFGFITQVGLYIYQPVFYESSVYERFGFNYKLGKHLLAEISLKANLFRAEAFEIGIGYTF